jgi:hypothetical protein
VWLGYFQDDIQKLSNYLLAVTMKIVPPPPVIDSARVLSYADVDDIPYQKHGRLYSGDRLIEKVPRLAICVNLGRDIGPLLFHCDEDWAVLGATGRDTVAECKARAEKNYPGVAACWIDLDTPMDIALEYYDAQTDNLQCSFCGRRSFDFNGYVEVNDVCICRHCVERMYAAFQETNNDASDG